MNKKLIGRLLLVFVIIVLIPAAVIYFTFDIRALEYLTMFKPWSIAAAFGILAVGLIFDGLRLMTLARVTDERLSIKEVINVVLSNYFLAVLTPGASGGAIAQIMFMKRANVPVAKATVIVFVRTIMSITFLILLVPFVLYNDAFFKRMDAASSYRSSIRNIYFHTCGSGAAYAHALSGVLAGCAYRQAVSRLQAQML